MAEVDEKFKHNRSINSKVKQFHSEGKYWDVQIRVDTEVFKCQRSLLVANSIYFDTIFSSDEESDIPADQPITLHGMDAKVFKELLRFMYVGEIRLRESTVLQIFVMNDFLQLRNGLVKERCLEYVKSRSQKDTPMSYALDLLCFAYSKGENVLVDRLRAHICRHLYHYYSEDAQLMEISYEILNALLEFSKDYILPVPGPSDILLKIVHKWINHNREGRWQYRSNLMENIDFGRISSNFSRSLIGGLENALDEVLNMSEYIKSLSLLKSLAVGIDSDLIDDNAQFDASIIFVVENVSEMQMGHEVFSPSYTISNLSWNIRIKRDEDDSFRVFLFCGGTNLCPIWSCYASARLTIVSQKEGTEDFADAIISRSMFSSDTMDDVWGDALFSNWNDVVDPEKGYLNDDNSITVIAQVHADVPFLKMM